MNYPWNKDGIYHECEGGEVVAGHKEPFVVWTLCEIDAQVNESFKSDHPVTCPKCLRLAIQDGVPCSHKGCEWHLITRCPGCGRFGAKVEIIT